MPVMAQGLLLPLVQVSLLVGLMQANGKSEIKPWLPACKASNIPVPVLSLNL